MSIAEEWLITWAPSGTMMLFKLRPVTQDDVAAAKSAWETAMPSIAPPVLDRKEAIKKMKPVPPTSISVDERIEVCKKIPQQDWERFGGLKHVAVSATKKRIVDGDNDDIALSQRVAAAHPADRIFHAPGRKRAVPARSRV